MLRSLKRCPALVDVIEKCNFLVLEVLEGSSIREAEIAIESFTNGGKRLRPALMLLSSRVPSGSPIERVESCIIELAGAVELIHLATLFHDDVIDGVDMRRSHKSARAKYGNHAAVLAGDFALSEALLLVQKSSLSGAMPEFLRTLHVLVRGESLETKHKFDFDMNEAVYYKIISEKSASLFALSCKAGALCLHPGFSDTLGHFGWNLGMAFQMIDDLDDMLDLPNNTHDCDLRNGYLSLPIIRALSSLEDGHREGLLRIIRGGSFSYRNEKYIVTLCNEEGTIEETKREIHGHLDHAGEILYRFQKSEARDMLELILQDLKAYAGTQVENFQQFAQR